MNTLEATVLDQSSLNLLRMIILTMSQSSSNMGAIGSKTWSVGQIMENLVNTLEATALVQSSSNLLRMIVLTMYRSSSNMDDVGSKTWSVGQIMEKPCEHSRGHSLDPIFITLAQNDHLDNISVKFEYG